MNAQTQPITKSQLARAKVQEAMDLWRSRPMTEREERRLIDVIVFAARHIGEGPLTMIMTNQPTVPATATADVEPKTDRALACPRCGERRFHSRQSVNGHLRTCQKA